MNKNPSIHMKDLKDKYNALNPGELILDVRTPEEFAEGHLPGAKNINHEGVDQYAPELKNYSKVYVHCRSGKRAQMAVDALEARGLNNLVLIKDSGMMDWVELGLPTLKGSK